MPWPSADTVILGQRAVLFTWKVPSARRGQDLRQAPSSQAKGTFICKRSTAAAHRRKPEVSHVGADKDNEPSAVPSYRCPWQVVGTRDSVCPVRPCGVSVARREDALERCQPDGEAAENFWNTLIHRMKPLAEDHLIR